MKEFNRQYTCRDDDQDHLSVFTLEYGLVSFMVESDHHATSAHLNREQAINIVELLQTFIDDTAPGRPLWEDKK